MAKKAKRLKRKNLEEGKIYVSLAHGYANVYRIVKDNIEFMSEEKGKPKWCGTTIDESRHDFAEITQEDMIVKLLEVKAYDKKRK